MMQSWNIDRGKYASYGYTVTQRHNLLHFQDRNIKEVYGREVSPEWDRDLLNF